MTLKSKIQNNIQTTCYWRTKRQIQYILPILSVGRGEESDAILFAHPA